MNYGKMFETAESRVYGYKISNYKIFKDQSIVNRSTGEMHHVGSCHQSIMKSYHYLSSIFGSTNLKYADHEEFLPLYGWRLAVKTLTQDPAVEIYIYNIVAKPIWLANRWRIVCPQGSVFTTSALFRHQNGLIWRKFPEEDDYGKSA